MCKKIVFNVLLLSALLSGCATNQSNKQISYLTIPENLKQPCKPLSTFEVKDSKDLKKFVEDAAVTGFDNDQKYLDCEYKRRDLVKIIKGLLK